MADKETSSPKYGETLAEYRRKQKEYLTEVKRKQNDFFTRSVDHRDVASKITNPVLIPIGNLIKYIFGGLIGVIFLAIIIGFIVFAGNCISLGTCEAGVVAIGNTFENTGTGKTLSTMFGDLGDIIGSGGASAIGGSKTSVVESNVRRYIELKSPESGGTYFESQPIIVSANAVAYNLSRDTFIDTLCSLSGYSSNNIEVTKPERIRGNVDRYPFSISCEFKDGLKIDTSVFDNKDQITSKLGKISLIYSGEAKSNWCVYTMHSSLLDYYNKKKIDPLSRIKDPQCISGGVGRTIFEYRSAQELVFGSFENQPFAEDRNYVFEIKLKEFADSDGNLYNLSYLNINVPPPASLVLGDNCAFEISEDRIDYTYKLKKSMIDSLNTDCSKEGAQRLGISVDECLGFYKEDRSFKCYLKMNLAKPEQLSTDILPEKIVITAESAYNYQLSKSFSVIVKKASISNN